MHRDQPIVISLNSKDKHIRLGEYVCLFGYNELWMDTLHLPCISLSVLDIMNR
jgi:hypothetical protein